MTTNVTPTPYGGYHLTHVREAGGNETLRFDAVLRHSGAPVAYVYNAGEGGSHVYQPAEPTVARAEFENGLAEFERFAAYWSAGSEFAGIEDGDQLVTRLLEVAVLNRMRKIAFLLDDQNYWRTGEYNVVRGSASREAVLAMLRQPAFAARNPRVWDRERCDWVPIL